MIERNDKLFKDLEAIRQIAMVDTMLEVICRTTGMGFAAIARVTEDRWLACSVRDEISFGLEPGGELSIKTTICNEIRANNTAVVINNVSEDTEFANHHTPKMYGFQSYISYPIILKNGDFFGTLCAIDPKPADLKNPRVIGTFTLFTELLSFHLQSIDLLERSHSALHNTNRELNYSQDENNEYKKISNHNLREPLRKMSLFTDMLVNHTESGDTDGAKKMAIKVNGLAQDLTKMITDITDFSSLTDKNKPFEKIDLNAVLLQINNEMATFLLESNTVVESSNLPVVDGIPSQLFQLFSQLLKTLVSYAKGAPGTVRVYAVDIHPLNNNPVLPKHRNDDWHEIIIENKTLVIEQRQLDKIFDILIHINEDHSAEGYGSGLANCRKISHYHGGEISISSHADLGTSFSIILPKTK